jgi:hypothetical protein
MGVIITLATLAAHVGRDFFDDDKPFSGTTILSHLLGP